MGVRAVIFDLFGTLVDNFAIAEYRAVIHRMADTVGAPAEGFITDWLAGVSERITGQRPSPTADILAICHGLGLDPPGDAIGRAAGIRFEYSRRALGTRPESAATVSEVQRRGYRTALVSDCTREIPELWNTTPFAGLFDALVFSCVEGLRKPDPRMYGLACERLGIKAGDCLYVGDGASTELSGARAAGMQPVQLLVRHESDEHFGRNEAEEWDGPVITELREVLGMLD